MGGNGIVSLVCPHDKDSVNTRFEVSGSTHPKSLIRGLLNISLQQPIQAPDEPRIVSGRECSKKFVQQGRSLFDARSVHFVRERERREERQACEPEGSAKGRERRWRLFSTFPYSIGKFGDEDCTRAYSCWKGKNIGRYIGLSDFDSHQAPFTITSAFLEKVTHVDHA